MKKTRINLARTATMLLFAVLSSFMAVGTSFAAGGNPTSGNCGDNDAPEAVTWSFNMSTQTLTISGEGCMADYESPSNAPWYSWCDDITSVVVADGVTHVSALAFDAGYWQLTNVSLASSVVSIGDYAFNGVPLKSIQPLANTSRTRADGGSEPVASVLPDDLQSIGKYALSGTQITSLTLPENVNFIGEAALSQNSKLSTLTCLGTMIIPWFEGDILEGCNALTAIYVPETVVDDYKNADCWLRYATLIQAIPEQGEEPGGEEPTEPGTITIGSGESYTDLPLTAQYKYALTQQVFSANEINHAKGKIWSIAFRTKNGDLTRKYNVYLTHTNQSSLSSSSWQPVTAADCYFSGEVTFTSGQWNTIYFDKPFEYDGKSNIVVTVDDNTGRSDGWGALTNAYFYGDGNHANARDNSKDIDPLDAESIASASNKGTQSYKNQIKFTFGDYPTPAYLAVAEVGDVSAQIQCSLRGDAKAWNVRYRKVAADGEEEQRWTQEKDLTTRSFTIEDLTAFTKYEVQVQAVFAAKEEGGEDILSAWTDPLVFTTNCCPVEDQADIIYAVNSNYSSWYGYAIQFMDITDENNPVEVAYINPVDYSFTGGKLTLCCGHKYKVNWIYDEEHSNVNHQFSLALYYDNGDKIFIMNSGEAPEETAELTTFVMDCTPYCTQMPQILNESGTTYNSATITFLSQTKTGQVVYSTEADFDPEKATPEDMDFEEVPQSEVPWDQPNASITLKGLQPLTAYYVRVRSICTTEPIGVSRWSDPVKVTTGSRYDAPTQVIAEPVNSRTEKLSWNSRGNEKSHNLYYRKQAAGNPVDPSAIQTFGGGKGTGFKSGSWGEGIQSSYGDHPFSNMLFVAGVPAGSSFGFKAGNGKTGAGQTKFFYGLRKFEGPLTAEETMKQFDKKCLNDADRQARIDDLNALLAQLELKIASEEITQEEYNQQKTAIEAEIASFNALPTDAQKLEQMRTLEQNIEDNNTALAALALQYANGEITNEQYEEQSSALEAQNALNGAELSELRAITTNAENPEKDGFSISRADQSPAQSRGLRAVEDETYIFFIRHSDPNGVLLVKDLTITPPELQGEWTVIPNVSGNSYMLTGLEPGTTYEVMVEPVYDGGTTGSRSPITVFTTLGEESEPLEGVFSVSKDKKVQFAKGNLQYSGDSQGYEAEWSVAKQQYEILGEKNIEESYGSTSPANPRDLFCWSTVNNYCGVYSYYYDDDDAEAEAHFKGDFADWGTDAKLASALGTGWTTLSKDEWNYLLNKRKDAEKLKMLATVAGVKGLVLLPDEWTAPDGVLISEEMTAETWATVENTGVVFLPVAGQMTTTYDNSSWTTTTTLTEAGTYWTSTPAGDKPDLIADVLTITAEGATLDANLLRRTYTAVRLVKVAAAAVTGDVNGNGNIDEADLNAVIDYIIGKTPTKPTNADMDGSGDVDIVDLTLMIKKIK